MPKPHNLYACTLRFPMAQAIGHQALPPNVVGIDRVVNVYSGIPYHLFIALIVLPVAVETEYRLD